MSIEDRIAQVVREVLAPLRTEIVEQVVAALRTQAAPPEAEWLSTADVARELQVTPGTVREWVKTGRLRAAPGTRYLRIHRADLRAFLSGGGGEADSSKVEQLMARLRK